MKIIYTGTAKTHIASQIAFLVEQGAYRPARRLHARITSYVRDIIARYPRAGRYIHEHDIYECWIPRTRFVVMYRLDMSRKTLTVLAVFHTSQDRSAFEPQ